MLHNTTTARAAACYLSSWALHHHGCSVVLGVRGCGMAHSEASGRARDVSRHVSGCISNVLHHPCGVRVCGARHCAAVDQVGAA